MKTIENFVTEKHLRQRELPMRKQIPAQNFIDWANIGAREAQRWIGLDEELPPDAVQVLVKLKVKMKDNMFEMPSLGVYHSFNKSWNIIHQNLDTRGDIKKWEVTHWRLIERL